MSTDQPETTLRTGPLRGPKVAFRFEGRPMVGVAGEPIAVALHANGVQVLSRSFKYQRPRGLTCLADACASCALRVNGLPGVTGCTTALAAGDVVAREHAWPNADHDLLGLVDRTSALTPAGFQYRRLRRSPQLFHHWERLLARLAGHGRIPEPGAAQATVADATWTTATTDVAVIGAGPAGLSAALAAADAGAHVTLVDRDRRLGGAALHGSADEQAAARELASAAASHPRIVVHPEATAIGWYAEGVVGVSARTAFTALTADRVVLATGSYEARIVFGDADRPGVMLADGALRLVRRHGVLPARRVVVVTDEERGHEAAAALREHGVEVVAVVDRRPASARPAGATPGPARVLHDAEPVRVLGTRAARGIVVTHAGRQVRLAAEAVLVSAGRRPADELLLQRLADVRPGDAACAAAGAAGAAADGPRPAAAGWWLAGGAAGTTTVPEAIASGRAAGGAAGRRADGAPR